MKRFIFLLFILVSLQNYGQDARWDDSFTAPNAPNGSVYALIRIGNNLVAAGSFTQAGGVAANNIALYNGTTWTPLGSGINGPVYCLAYYGGKLTAGGNFTMAGGTPASNIAQWDGTSWSAPGSGSNGPVLCLYSFDPYLYIGGDFTQMDGSPASHLARWNGMVFDVPGNGTNGTVNSLCYYNGIVAGGTFTLAGATSVQNIALWDGSSWNTMNMGLDGTVYALTEYNDTLYAGGAFTTASAGPVSHLAKWNSTSWIPVSGGTNGTVYALKTGTDLMYAGGNYTTAGATASANITIYNGNAFTTLGSGTNQTVRALLTISTDLYCGGDFIQAGNKPSEYIGRYIGLPAITEQSNDTLVCQGTDLHLMVAASGTESLNYSWTRNGLPIGTNNDTLEILNVSFSDTGTYICTISHAYGSVSAYPVHLSMGTTPAFSGNATDTSLCEGTLFSFQATASAFPTPAFSWEHDGNQVLWAIGDSFPFFSVQHPDSGTYICNAANICGTASSMPFILHVNPLPVVNLLGLQSGYCLNFGPDTLAGLPTGGVFSGNGLTGNIFNPAGLSGTQPITYTFTNTYGCTDSITEWADIHPVILVTFTGLEPHYCAGANSDTLYGLPTGGAYAGPGLADSVFTASAAGPGLHLLTYTIIDDYGCENIATHTTQITAMPVIQFLQPDTHFCTAETETLIHVLPNGGTFSGIGLSDSTFYPSIAGTGTHTLLYSYDDFYGCHAESSIEVVVDNSPVVSISGLLTEYCSNQSVVTPVLTPSGGIFSGFGVTGNQFDPTQALPGLNSLVYTYSDANQCSGTDTAVVNILYASSVFFTGADSTYCGLDQSSALTGVPAGGIFSGAGIQNDTFYTSLSGTGTIILQYSYDNLNGCISTTTQSVSVSENPAVDLGPDTSVCMGGTITIIPGADPGSFLWSTGDTTPVLVYQVFAPTTISLIVDNGICQGMDTLEIVQSAPAAVSLGPDTSFCSGSVLNAPGGYSTYLWSVGSVSQSIVVTTSGTYAVTVTTSEGCIGTDSIGITLHPGISVNLGPDIQMTTDQNLVIGIGPNLESYLWNTGDTSNTINIDGELISAGIHYYWITACNFYGCCKTDTIIITVIPGVGTGPDNLIHSVRVYPNPARDRIFVEGYEQGAVVTLCDHTGKIITKKIANNSFSDELWIDVASLPAGLYLVNYSSQKTSITHKIVII